MEHYEHLRTNKVKIINLKELNIIRMFGFFKRKKEEEKKEEEFVEIDESLLSESKKLNVRIESLKNFADTERIQNLIREGNIVFLRIKELKDKDLTELKRSVDKLKKTIIAMNGDIVGIGDDLLVICPSFARIHRG